MKKCKNVFQCQCNCGESPLWLSDSGEMLFIDTGEDSCYSYNPAAGAGKKYPAPGPMQSLAKTGAGEYLATLPDKVILCNDEYRILEDFPRPLREKSYMILNDGTVGPDGCFYFSIINAEDLYSKEGAVARLNTDFSIEIVAEGFALPNGLAFDSPGTRFYVTEMFANTIHRFDFSAESGVLSGKKSFAVIPEEDGMPDGLIIDSEDFLWSAHWQGFRVTRYDPDGKIERTVSVPVPTPTCMAFGGEEMTTLYITTAKKGLSEQQLQNYPQSGDLFMVETEIQGRIERTFSGARE